MNKINEKKISCIILFYSLFIFFQRSFYLFLLIKPALVKHYNGQTN